MIHWHLVAKMRNNLSFNKRFQFAQLCCTILIKFQRKKTCGQAADRGVPKTTGTIEDTKWPLAVWRANRAHFAINLLRRRRRRRDTVNFNIYIIESRARPRWLLKFMFLVVLMHCHNAPRTHTISPPDGVRLLTQSALASVANYGQMIGRCPFFRGVGVGVENVRLSKFAIVERIVCASGVVYRCQSSLHHYCHHH